MGTALREGGWAFIIHTDDHPPPHVHARRGNGEVKVSLPPPGECVQVLRVRHLAPHEAMRGVRLVEQHREWLLLEWKRIHG